MALSGMHATFGYLHQARNEDQPIPVPIYGIITGSDTRSTAGTFTPAAQKSVEGRVPIVSVYSTVDAYITHGKTPSDPSQAGSARRFVPALTFVDQVLPPGDFVAWAPA